MRHSEYRYLRKMTYTRADLVKISILFVLLAFLAYNAMSKLVFVERNVPKVQILADYQVCNAVDKCEACMDKINMKESCRQELDDSFRGAEIKCKGFVNNLQKCKDSQAQSHNNCRIEFVNVDACVNSVVGNTVKKWQSVDRLTQ